MLLKTFLIKNIQIKEFEIETPSGRAKERNRRVILTVLANALSRGVSLLTVILSLRIALPYLGEERFGVMSTISSLAMLLTFLDLGVGNGLVSQIARLRSTNNTVGLAHLIGNALFILSLIGLLATSILILLSWQSPLAWAFKGVKPTVLEEARSTLMVFVIMFGLSIPLGAIQRIFSGMQEGYTAQLITAAISLLGLIILYYLPSLDAGIPSFLAVISGVQVAAGIVMLLILFARKLVKAPNINILRGSEIRSLLKTSGLFFVLQIGSVLGFGADNLLISSFLGPIGVTQLVIVQRMFMLITIPLSIINAPLWASYADAASKGDKEYIKRTFRRSMTITPIFASCGGIFILFSYGFFANIFSKGSVSIDPGFVFIFAIWSVIESTGNAFAMYLNGMHIVKPQVIVIILFVIVSIPLKLIFLSHFGVIGVLYAAILAYTVTTVIPYLTFFRREVLSTTE